MATYVDDKFDHLESDIDKIRLRHRQYISYSNEAGAKSVVDEIFHNADDECKNPRSPGNKISVRFSELDGFIEISDNGRGMPTDIMEKVFTSLNMGSNINTSNKASLKVELLGQNGTGTLAICGLAERVEITSYRGGTENKYKLLVFEEGVKVHEEDGPCDKNKHGLTVRYKPSKIMGKQTRIIWDSVRSELDNYQYLNNHNIKLSSQYTDKSGTIISEEYKPKRFDEILTRNDKDKNLSSRFIITFDDDNVNEELDGENVRRFISLDIAFMYTSLLTPYIDSFSNGNNTVDNGDHLDGAIEALCRFLQTSTKNMMSEKERSSLDIKWDDVKTGLSIAVNLRSNFERLYTGQTKHKVVSPEVRKIIVNLAMNALNEYFSKNPSQLKELCSIVKMNAKVRREGDKVRTAVVKNNLTNWSTYKMTHYEPCTRKGVKEYKELFIIEGDSAKGSLKPVRDPEFQALYAIRGVSANVYKMTLDQIVGPKGNREFTDLITIMGCNVGPKFDMSKLQFNKIIIASDADIDGLFIRNLLMAFFFKLFPEIIMDGRLFIAEPPLYRVKDKNNPFVINMADYINRYAKKASNKYIVGYKYGDNGVEYIDKKEWIKFLTETATYVEDMNQLSEHYKLNGILLEIILREFALMNVPMDDLVLHPDLYIPYMIKSLNIQKLMDEIGTQFDEIFYDDKWNLVTGNIDMKPQSVEISPSLIRQCRSVIRTISRWGNGEDCSIVLKDINTKTEHELSLLGVLRILNKFQPEKEHRFKGLGENDPEDIKTTIMDPNTRTLIRVNISDIENDAKVFQLLRGNSPADAIGRKTMMSEFRIDKELIDT